MCHHGAMPTFKLSVVMLCHNNYDTIEAACRSVLPVGWTGEAPGAGLSQGSSPGSSPGGGWVDELLVVDSGSTDGTDALAARYATRVLRKEWVDFSTNRRWAVEQAAHDRVLLVDSDEQVSDALRAEIEALDEAAWGRYDLFLIPRRNWVLGREVPEWWPDRLTRLFDRRKVTWNDHALHDARRASDPARVGRLRGWFRHKAPDSGAAARFSDYFSGARMDARLMMVARQMHERGKRCRWWDLALRPAGAFLKHYLLRGGWRRGSFGLLIAQKAATGTQLKYAALWAVQHGGGDGANG